MSARVFVDTNLLAYLFDAAEPKKRARARRVLESELADHELVVSTQVLQELYVCLTRGKDPIASSEIAERAVRDAASFTVVQVDVPLVLAAVAESQRSQVSFWDALVIRAAVSAGCERLITEDLNDGQIFESVRVQNPFR